MAIQMGISLLYMYMDPFIYIYPYIRRPVEPLSPYSKQYILSVTSSRLRS